MKFLLVMEGNEGCDYSIGCGLAITEIEANDPDAAIEVAFREMASDYADSPRLEDDIKAATLYEIRGAKIGVPVDEFRQELLSQEEDAQLAQNREAEYRQYLELKARYERNK